jgi:hypothetical protein
MLFMALEAVKLNDQEDSISWRWTANGVYSVASAYECQFLGSMIRFKVVDIWKAKTEQKCKFFAWLVSHNRALTDDNMIKKGWPCNHLCSLCSCIEETTSHLLAQCNYSEAVWNLIAPHFNLPGFSVMVVQGGPKQWFNFVLRSGNKKGKQRKSGVLFTFWWLIWKERNKRIFEHKESSAPQLAVRETPVITGG